MMLYTRIAAEELKSPPGTSWRNTAYHAVSASQLSGF